MRGESQLRVIHTDWLFLSQIVSALFFFFRLCKTSRSSYVFFVLHYLQSYLLSLLAEGEDAGPCFPTPVLCLKYNPKAAGGWSASCWCLVAPPVAAGPGDQPCRPAGDSPARSLSGECPWGWLGCSGEKHRTGRLGHRSLLLPSARPTGGQ